VDTGQECGPIVCCLAFPSRFRPPNRVRHQNRFQHDFQATLEHRSPLLAIASKTFEAPLCNAIQQGFVNEVDTICGINSDLDDDTLTKRREARVQLTAMARTLGGRSALLADEWEVALAGRWPKSKLGAC